MHAKSAPRAFTALYPNLTSLSPFSPPEALLTDVETFSPSLDYTLQLFLRPSQYRNISTSISPSYAPSTTPPDALEIERQATRSGSYRALIFSTGAHFSARHFNLPFKPEGGPNAQIEFFDLALREMLNRFARALESASPEERRGKEVVVRPTTMGHDDCHEAGGPLDEEDEKKSSWWSWPDMWRMNEHGAVSLSLPSHSPLVRRASSYSAHARRPTEHRSRLQPPPNHLARYLPPLQPPSRRRSSLPLSPVLSLTDMLAHSTPMTTAST